MTAKLSWFGAYQRTSWQVGEAREAAGNGRYQIRRNADDFSVKHCPPYLTPDVMWVDIGTAVSAEAAIAIAQAHNDQKS